MLCHSAHSPAKFIQKVAFRLLPSNLRRRNRSPSGEVVSAFESLEARQLLSAINSLSDEFDDPSTLSNWSRINETEGWNVDQLNQWDIGQTRNDQMTMVPESVTWFQDYRGPYVFKNLSGDFAVTTRVEITDRDDISGSDGDDIPGDGLFSLAGLMIRTPRAIASPADWNPGSRLDDGTNNGENYVFLSLGYGASVNEFSFEVKTTRNSNSQLELTPLGPDANTALLQIARIGDTVLAMYQLPGQEWQVHRRYDRPDMPDAMQVGMVTYSDWNKASTLAPFAHNSTVITPGNDPTPATPFNPDLNAGFDYARFVEPEVPAALVGVDLLNTATDEQLLSFLGANANVPFVHDPDVVNVSLNIHELDAVPGIEVGEIFELDVDFFDAANSQAVYAGYADVNFDPAALEVLNIVYDSDYANGHAGTINNVAGIVNEVGATAGDSVPTSSTVVTLRLRALQAGVSTISADAGEDLLSEILTYSTDTDLRSAAVFADISLTVGSIDLESTEFDAASDHLLLGQTDVSFTVANTGSADAGSFEAHVVWSPNAVAGDGDDVVIADSTQTFLSLAAGASESRTISLQLDRAALMAHSIAADPAGQGVGTISEDVSHLFLFVDVNNTVSENDETNNSGADTGISSEEVTYFPWDKNSNGVVTPFEALTALRAINTNDPMNDFDGNGVVTPLEVLSAIQRIGYLINAAGTPESSPVENIALNAASLSENAEAGPAAIAAATAWLPEDDEDAVQLFPTSNENGTATVVGSAGDDDIVDVAFLSGTDWLTVV